MNHKVLSRGVTWWDVKQVKRRGRWRQGGGHPQAQREIVGSEPVLCSGDGKIFVLRMESQDLITDGTPRWATARRRGVDDAHGSSWTVTACDCPGGRGTGRVLPLVLGCPEGQRSLTVQRPVAPASGSVCPLLCSPPTLGEPEGQGASLVCQGAGAQGKIVYAHV